MLIPYFPNPFNLDDYYSILSDTNKELNLLNLGFNNKYQFVNNASHGIYLLLKSFNLDPGSRVGLPPLLCNTVTIAILKAKLEPYYLDINNDYILNFDEQSFNKAGIRALILPHLYGALHSECEEIETWCKNNKVLLISDTAQSFGLKHHDLPAIELGDGGVYSFGFGKASSCAGGGVVYNLNSQISCSDNPFINMINNALSKHKLASRTFGLNTYKRDNLLRIFNGYLSHSAAIYNPGIARIQFNSLKKFLDHREEIQMKRINNYTILRDNLDPKYFIVPESFNDTLKFKYAFSLNPDENKFSEFTRAMQKEGIEIHNCSHTDSIHTQDRILPNYNKIKNQLLELSTESSIPEDNFYKASDIMNSYFKKN